MNNFEQTRRNRLRRYGSFFNGLFSAGIGSLAVIDSNAGHYSIAVPEAITAAGLAFEAYRNLRHGKQDGRGYLIATIGGVAGLPEVLSNAGEGGFLEVFYRSFAGQLAVAYPLINSFVTLGLKLSRKNNK